MAGKTASFIIGLSIWFTISQAIAFQNVNVNGQTESVKLVEGTNRVLSFPFNIPEMWVANPGIVQAVPLAPNRIMLSGIQSGATTITVMDESRNMQSLSIVVRGDVRELQGMLQQHFPGSLIKAHALKEGVVLTGFVSSTDQIAPVVEIAEDYFPARVVNQIQVQGNQMIAINVKVYEVSRLKLRQLGVDWSFFGDEVSAVQSVSELIQQIGSNSAGASGQTLTFGVVDNNSSFNLFIDALEQRNLAKLLDEPTLVTQNGRAAEFLSGGEIPIPVTTGLGNTSIQYRSFGTKLDIIPISHGNGDLTLEVRAEVSDVARDLSSDNGAPGFRVRRVNTGVRMKVGHTLALAGDYKEETESVVRGVPGLMDAPLIGPAFRKTMEQKTESELVFLITPKFIGGVESNQVPSKLGTFSKSPNDRELYIDGLSEVHNPNPQPYATQPYSTQGTQQVIYPMGQSYNVQPHYGQPVPTPGFPTQHVPSVAPSMSPPLSGTFGDQGPLASPQVTAPTHETHGWSNLSDSNGLNLRGAPEISGPFGFSK